MNIGWSNIESNIEWAIFWQNSNIELNQIRYRTPLASCDLNTRIFSKMCVCSNLWRVKSLGERESSGFGRHRILLPPQIGQLDPPRFYFIIRQINWIRVKSRQQTHEASNFGFNFWPCNHSGELAKQSNFLNSPSLNFIWISYKDVAVVAQKSGQNLTLKNVERKILNQCVCAESGVKMSEKIQI